MPAPDSRPDADTDLAIASGGSVQRHTAQEREREMKLTLDEIADIGATIANNANGGDDEAIQLSILRILNAAENGELTKDSLRAVVDLTSDIASYVALIELILTGKLQASYEGDEMNIVSPLSGEWAA